MTLVAAEGVCACCRAAATASAGGGESNEKLQLQLRQAQQMAAAVARKKEDAMMKLRRLTDKQVWHDLLCCLCLRASTVKVCMVHRTKMSLKTIK